MNDVDKVVSASLDADALQAFLRILLQKSDPGNLVFRGNLVYSLDAFLGAAEALKFIGYDKVLKEPRTKMATFCDPAKYHYPLVYTNLEGSRSYRVKDLIEFVTNNQISDDIIL